MDRQSTNNDITQLLLAIACGDPRVSDSIRRRLFTMGNGDDDIARMIIGLLRQSSYHVTQPHIPLHLLNDSVISTLLSSFTSTNREISWPPPTGGGDANPLSPISRWMRGETSQEGNALSNISSSSQQTTTSQHDLITNILNAQSNEQRSFQSRPEFLSQEGQRQGRDERVYQNPQHIENHHSNTTGDDLQQYLSQFPLLSSLRREVQGDQWRQRQQQPQIVFHREEAGALKISPGDMELQQQQFQRELVPPQMMDASQNSLSIGQEGNASASIAAIRQTISGESEHCFGIQEDGRSSLFPFILHGLLRDLEQANQTSVASWNEKGDAFQIHREDVFCNKLLRVYFHLETMVQFQLLLDDWGFECAYTNEDGTKLLYRHPDFQKHSLGLQSLTQMKKNVLGSTSEPSRKRTKRIISGGLMIDGIKALKNLDQVDDCRKPISSSHKLSRDDELVDPVSRIAGHPTPKRSQSWPMRDLLYVDKGSEQKMFDSKSSFLECVEESRDNFLAKLMGVLRKSEHDPTLKKVICWSSHGLSFVIHDCQAFVDTILPHLMEELRSYEAFEETILCGWGFQKVKNSPPTHFHRLFQRDKPTLFLNMTKKQMSDAMICHTYKPTTLDTNICTTDSANILISDVGSGQDARQLQRGRDETIGKPIRSFRQNPSMSDEETPKTDLFVPSGSTESLHFQASNNNKSESVQQVSSYDSTGRERAVGCMIDSHLDIESDQLVSLDTDPRNVLECFRINQSHDSYDVSGLMFPWQLHQMLDDIEGDNEQAIGWNDDGASFFVRNHDKVVSALIPKYFSKIMSWNEFTTELSSWGFVCFTGGPQKGAFIHRLLSKGKPSLCKQMRYQGKTVVDMLKNKAAFLLRLHDTLSMMKSDFTSPACWSSDGRSFFIIDPGKFFQDTFSIYYESMTFATFEQKLRSWGFVQIPVSEGIDTTTSESLHYSHPYFLRDKKPVIHRVQSDIKAESISVEHSFIVRLRIMLDDVDKHGHQIIVSWLPHGRGFMIHDRSLFSTSILPYYFKTKLTSFRQTLRSYGFAQMGGKSWDSGSYYHKLFVKEDPSLCQGLKQDAMKKAMPEWIHPQDEPNFYTDGWVVSNSDSDKKGSEKKDDGAASSVPSSS